MTSTAAQILDRLTTQWGEETANLSSSHENFDDVARHVEDKSSDSKSHISPSDDTLKWMTNFPSPELYALWALVESAVTNAWTQVRGRTPSVSRKDALFITLTKLKHFDT
ncbi:hypothetical protein PHMEG_0009958 [Phytophthora megakarya]|uniref:Uncharacterized protein n=1 Tax=Phytophthora megakarya TaxID=4795 RepID=A0A225WEW2_9STRA|nr:hypothetical protein PHMEG_0009958 [Phytophthora megakarya]